MEYTVFTNLRVTGDLQLEGTAVIPSATFAAIFTAPALVLVAEAAGSSPTAAEFKALLDALKAAGIMSAT